MKIILGLRAAWHYLSKSGLFLGVMGIFCLLLGCDSGYSESSTREAPSSHSVASRPSKGSPAPDFRLMDMKGKPVSLSDFKGKVVLLNFWATWCGPCRIEMPAMEALYRSMRSKGLEIVAVSVDQQGTAVTRPFQEAMGLSFPILHDQDYEVGLTYGARTLPMTFAIDRQGIIRQVVFGSRDWNSPEARRGIAEVLQESIPESSQRM
ncbi:MAG: TlpA disulfide reductase family protein [Nitrospirales bacterium]|nr:TlpA family protein disulfide reductase [Nitrospirales bacterium]MDR4485782.1 TlpA family protein disulfide reductase [Nitrospirales bacterium]